VLDLDEVLGAEKEKQFENKVAHIQKQEKIEEPTPVKKPEDKKKKQMEQLYGKKANKNSALKEIADAKE